MSEQDRLGQLEVAGKVATITFERYIGHPPAAVWQAITDPAEVRAWFGEMEIEPGADGHVGMLFDGDGPESDRQVGGRILAWEPLQVFEYEWQNPGLGDTVVRFELEAAEGGTRLRVIHRSITVESAKGYTPGWHAYLDRLEAHVAGEELPDWWGRYQEVAENYG